MATWGTKTFEDDTATDWVAELVDAEESREVLLAGVTLPEDEELDYDSGVIALAACEVIIALIDEPRKGLPEELKDWLADNECDDITDLPETALPAIDRVLSEESELYTTWQSADDYDEWREGVDEMREIMEQLAQA